MTPRHTLFFASVKRVFGAKWIGGCIITNVGEEVPGWNIPVANAPAFTSIDKDDATKHKPRPPVTFSATA